MKDKEKQIEERFLDIGYESPITIIQHKMKIDIDNGVYKAVQNAGFSVDRDELKKALKYDREQYMHGFNNGYKFGNKETAEYFLKEYGYLLSQRAKDEIAKQFGVEIKE